MPGWHERSSDVSLSVKGEEEAEFDGGRRASPSVEKD